ncbi:MAG: hypothetical protein JEY99_15310 [Spirochaetales bacterium]|nr:hypothetical protein [Spirochaetales bacterium]
MKKINLLILLMMTINLSTFAQDSMDDELLLDIFAEETEEPILEIDREPEIIIEQDQVLEESEKSPSLIDQLYSNLQGETKGVYVYYFNELTQPDYTTYSPEHDQHIFEAKTIKSTFAQISNIRLKADLISFFGNEEERYRPALANPENMNITDWIQNKNNERLFLSFKELYMSVFFDNFDIYLGKKIISNTLSTIYSPADIYSPVDLVDPFSSEPFGNILLEFDYYFNNIDITAIILPVYQGNKNYSQLSRWGYYPFVEAAASAPFTITALQENYPEINLENISYLLKLKTRVKSVDLFTSAFYGLNQNIVTKTITTMGIPTGGEEEVIPVIQASAGFSSTLKKLELHGEGLYNYSLNSKDDNYLSYCGGLRYIFDEFSAPILPGRLELTMEYAGEYLMSEQSHEDYMLSSSDRRGLKNDLLLSTEATYNEDLLFRVSGQYEFDDKNLMTLTEVSYKGIENIKLNLRWQHFVTSDDGDLYNWRDNSSLVTEAIISY